jgi:hypothetical protein
MGGTGSGSRARRKEAMVSAANSENSDARDRMLGSVPGAAALGRGPVPDGDFSRHEYHHPAAGWGAARSVAEVPGCIWTSARTASST